MKLQPDGLEELIGELELGQYVPVEEDDDGEEEEGEDAHDLAVVDDSVSFRTYRLVRASNSYLRTRSRTVPEWLGGGSGLSRTHCSKDSSPWTDFSHPTKTTQKAKMATS
eukprot:SAG31_NODE_21_length_34109_cov_60.598824_12_plen_110_part_00